MGLLSKNDCDLKKEINRSERNDHSARAFDSSGILR